MKCPNCSLFNPDTAMRCDCGYDFRAKHIKESHVPKTMPMKQQYPLEANGTKRLEVSWQGVWKDLTVRLDGKLIGTISNQTELKTGREFKLPDESATKVQRKGGLLLLYRNGSLLPSIVDTLRCSHRKAYQAVYLLGVLNLLIGFSSIASQDEPGIRLRNFGISFGLVFLGLGFFTMRKSLVALLIALAILAIDSATVLTSILSAGRLDGAAILGIVFRSALLIRMLNGISATSILSHEPLRRETT